MRYISMSKKIVLLFLVIASAFLFCGCEEFREAMEMDVTSDNPMSEDYKPRFVVGVFGMVQYPRATELEREIDMPNGRSVWINTNQSFSSRNLRGCKVIARPGNPDVCDLRFKLDKRGRTIWEMLAGRFRGEAVVLAVDGRGVGKFIPEFPESNSNWVTLRIGIDAYTARGIVKYAERNYDYYNPDAGKWFEWMFEK